MRVMLRSLVLVSLALAGSVVGCGKSSSSGGAPTQASVDSNCMFVCADLLEGCPQPTRAASQTACVNTCKADMGKAFDKVKGCSSKVSSATGAKRCTAVNDCVAGK